MTLIHECICQPLWFKFLSFLNGPRALMWRFHTTVNKTGWERNDGVPGHCQWIMKVGALVPYWWYQFTYILFPSVMEESIKSSDCLTRRNPWYWKTQTMEYDQTSLEDSQSPVELLPRTDAEVWTPSLRPFIYWIPWLRCRKRSHKSCVLLQGALTVPGLVGKTVHWIQMGEIFISWNQRLREKPTLLTV